LFSFWFFSLLQVLIPIAGWGTPTFPVAIDARTRMMFLVSTILLAATSFVMGLEKLGAFSHIAIKLHLREDQSVNLE
jgi:hypothetical protein